MAATRLFILNVFLCFLCCYEFLLVLNINLVNKCSILVYTCISQLVKYPTIQFSDSKRDNKPVI